jgi:hypothetical protein
MSKKRFTAIFLASVLIMSNLLSVFATEYTYDELGRLTSVKYGGNDSKTATYNYDPGGNIQKVNGFVGESTTEQVTETTTEQTYEIPIEATTVEYVWNYSDNTNTGDFFNVSANNWSNAVSVTYGEQALTKAVKLESSSLISFNAPHSGKLTLVTYSTNENPSVNINGQAYSVSENGATEIEIPQDGVYNITRGTTNTYIYYMLFTYEVTPPTPYVWNYTNGTNSEDFYTVNANNWSNAIPVTYNDNTLTKAVKLETTSSITFTAPSSGKLTLVTYSTNEEPKVKINDVSYSVSSNGATEIPINGSGTYTLTKDTTNTYLYYISFVTE